MLNPLPITASVAILAISLSAPTFAQSSSPRMSHDTMARTAVSSGSGMGRHDTMSRDSLSKRSLSHDTMPPGSMGRDTMSRVQ
jgi:pentapeptide MXKDX repeat protein